MRRIVYVYILIYKLISYFIKLRVEEIYPSNYLKRVLSG